MLTHDDGDKSATIAAELTSGFTAGRWRSLGIQVESDTLFGVAIARSVKRRNGQRLDGER